MHHLDEGETDCLGLLYRQSGDEFGHHAGARLGDGAPLTFVADQQTAVWTNADFDSELVAAGRVHVVGRPEGLGQQPLTARVLVVVEDDLLIQGFKAHGATPKNSCAAMIPVTALSISDSSL